MKKIFYLLSFVFVALSVNAQTLPSTTYTRELLRATNSVDFVNRSGMTNFGALYVANYTSAASNTTYAANQVVFIGDSLTDGTGATANYTTYPYQTCFNVTGAGLTKNATDSGWPVMTLCSLPGGTAAQIWAKYVSMFSTNSSLLVSIPVLWPGNNDVNTGMDFGAVTNYLASFIATNVQASKGRFLVLSLIANTNSDAAKLLTLTNLNAAISNMWPAQYVDVRTALGNATNGSAADTGYSAAGYAPLSLLSDLIHLNDAGQAVLAKAVAKRLPGLLASPEVPAGQALVKSTFDTWLRPEIGGGTPTLMNVNTNGYKMYVTDIGTSAYNLTATTLNPGAAEWVDVIVHMALPITEFGTNWNFRLDYPSSNGSPNGDERGYAPPGYINEVLTPKFTWADYYQWEVRLSFTNSRPGFRSFQVFRTANGPTNAYVLDIAYRPRYKAANDYILYGGLCANTNTAAFSNNVVDLTVSNNLTLGSISQTILNSGSAGLSVDKTIRVPAVVITNSFSVGTNLLVTSNSLTVAEGSANTLVVTNGNVGIGTGTPQAALHIASGALLVGNNIFTGAGNVGIFFDVLNSFTMGVAKNTTQGDLCFYSGSSVPKMTLTTNGNLGIGRTRGATALDVNGTITALGAIITNTLTASNIIIGTTYPTVITSDSTGLVTDQPLTVGGTTPGVTIGSGGPSITASGKTLTVSTNVSIGTNFANFAYGSANTVVITNGRLGVGIQPLKPLHVVGNGTITGGLGVGIDASVDTGNVWALTTGGDARILVGDTTSSYNEIRWDKSYRTLRIGYLGGTSLAIRSNLFVGVGTTNPATLLDVNGTLTASNIVFSATNLYDDLMYFVNDLNPPGGLTGPTIVATSGRDSESLAAVFNADDAALLTAQMPHTWVPGSTIHPHWHIEPQTTDAITNVWRVKYSIADITGEFPAWTVSTNTTIIPANNQWKHMLVDVPEGGISMSGKTGPSTGVKLRFELISSNVDTHVIAADIHYRVGGSPVPYDP